MAVSKTTRLGLSRWTEDTDPWSRDDFDDDNAQLEALAAIGRSGPFADRGAAATWTRSTYYATDHQTLYVSTGAAWRRLEFPNLSTWPMLSSIPRGAGTVDDLGTPASVYLGDQTAIMHRMYLPGGMNIASIAIARGNGGDVTPNRLWFAIYNGIVGAKLATTADNPGTINANSTRSAAFAGGFVVPAPGIYTIMCYAGSAAQFTPVGALTNSAIAGTSTTVLGANLDPAGAPADLSFGVVPRAAVPWFGFELNA